MKKKWLSWLLVSIAALLVVAGIIWLRHGDKLFHKNVFVDPNNNVSFEYPNEWTIVTGATNPYLIATVASSTESEYTPIFNVTKEYITADMTLDKYISQTMNQLEKVIVGFNHNQAEPIDVDGVPGKKVSFSGEYLDAPFSWEQVYTIKDGSVFVLTYLAPSDHFAGSRDAVETSFSTFSFKKE